MFLYSLYQPFVDCVNCVITIIFMMKKLPLGQISAFMTIEKLLMTSDFCFIKPRTY